MKNLSIKVKLLLLLLFVPTTYVIIFNVFTIDFIKKDKISYLYEYNNSKLRTNSEVIEKRLTLIEHNIDSLASMYFNRKLKDRSILELIFKQFNYIKSFVVFDTSTKKPLFKVSKGLLKLDYQDYKNSSFGIHPLQLDKSLFLIKKKFRDKYELYATFEEHSFQSFLGDSAIRAFISFQEQIYNYNKNESSLSSTSILTRIKEKIFGKQLQEYTTRISSADDNIILALRNIGSTKIVIGTITNEELVMGPIQTIIYRFTIFIILLIAGNMMISLVISSNFNVRIQKLVNATIQVANANYDIDIEDKSNDELTKLGFSFKMMANKIKELIAQTAENARMENELKTAQLVQNKIIPKLTFEQKNFSLSGYYQSASECGGDWIYYKKLDNKMFVCIGDVTGHGAAAAMMTSASLSAISLGLYDSNRGTSYLMKQLNDALHHVSKGDYLMTCFMVIIDFESKKIEYSNAGHEPPLVFRKTDDYNKSNIVTLNEANSERLAFSLETEYTSASFQLRPNDIIFYYSDGLVEEQNSQKKCFGERKVIKSILKSANEKVALDEAVHRLQGEFNKFIGKKELSDDVSYLLTKLT